MQVLLDQVYAEPAGIPLEVDLFRPDTEGPVPLVMCIHGGGWISGSRAELHPEARWLASQGFAAACPSYRLAPLHPCPAAIEDVFACLQTVRERADQWGIRPDRIASWGISAGGHLASMLGLANDPGVEPIQAVVSVCGLADLTNPHERHKEIAWGFLDQFLSVPFEGNEAFFEAASPTHRVRPGVPPFLVIHGDADDVVSVSESDGLVERLRNAGTEVEYHRLPGEQHALSDSAWSFAKERILQFLDERLRG